MFVPQLFNAVVTKFPTERLTVLESKIEKLNRRAIKLGTPKVHLYVHRTYITKKPIAQDEYGRVIYAEFEVCDIGIIGPKPVVEGWHFVARIEHTEAGNIVTAPGGEVDPSWREAKGECQHCGHRRARRDTFLLRRGTELKQVGRNCLKDFLAGDVASALALYDLLSTTQDVARDDDEEGGYGRWKPCVTSLSYLIYACAAVRQFGFVPTKGDCPTVRTIDDLMRIPPKDRKGYEAWLKGQPTEEDHLTAVSLLLWLDEAPISGDYIANLKVACALEVLDVRRHGGLVASVPAAYRRHLGEVTERAAKPVSSHVGEVKERREFDLTVTKVSNVESEWGAKTFVVFADDAGNVFTWGASGIKDLEPGQKLRVKGTIKRHSEYRGTKQTELTRCTIISIL